MLADRAIGLVSSPAWAGMIAAGLAPAGARCEESMDGSVELIGVREAARRLDVEASSVTRYLRRYPHLNRAREGEAPQVSWLELRQHRAENINVYLAEERGEPAPASGAPGATGAEDQAAAAPAETPPPASAAPNAGSGAALSARAEREKAEAQLRQLQLADKLGLLAPKREIADAAFGAGQALREGLDRRRAQLAEQLVTMDDRNEVLQLLKAEDHRLLNDWIAELQRQLEEIVGGPLEAEEHAA